MGTGVGIVFIIYEEGYNKAKHKNICLEKRSKGKNIKMLTELNFKWRDYR